MGKPVILIVDDEDGIRKTISSFLGKRFDCDFKEAENGEDAVRFAKENVCDVMVLDIKMPKKGGISVLKDVKALNREIDILIVSAWISDDVAEEAMSLGATDYAIKPLDLKALSMKFSDILKRRGQLINKTLGSAR